MNKLEALQTLMQAQNIDYYLVPRVDEFQSEYLPAYAERLAYLTGFTGSFAFAIIGLKKSAVFTDGRYDLQIKDEVDHDLFECHIVPKTKPEEWLKEQAIENAVVGYEPELFSEDAIKKFELDKIDLKALSENLIDQIWDDKPAFPTGEKIPFGPESAGQTSASKIDEICTQMKENNCDALIVSTADAVCWLLNIRGDDIPYNPLILSYVLLKNSGEYKQYSFHKNAPNPSEILNDIQAMDVPKCFWIDPKSTPLHILNAIEENGHKIYRAKNPITLKKACKNRVELEGMRDAHIKDAIALSEFSKWFETHKNPYVLTELDLVAKLKNCREMHDSFIQDSFPTICGSKDHGAIVHYRATHATNQMIQENELVLLDSGGQYQNGTTDITRMYIKGTPSAKMIVDYTNVLKGHIALARAVFPKGTKGVQLDALARQYLWQEKCDFAHGTGHGVGHFACVHEGPQRISPVLIDEALEVGMVLSNEPGLYRNGEYGIRIENLMIVKHLGLGLNDIAYYGFENLTWVPLEKNLINKALLSSIEISWINAYHKETQAKIIGNHKTASDHFVTWLEKKCSPL